MLNILKKQKEITRIIVTNNEYVNAMLNLKISEASSKNIEMVVNTISDIGDTDNWDLCNLLGNMLDNAIRSCEKTSKKYMTLQIFRDKNGYFNIIVKNQIENSVLKNNPTLKSDKFNASEHGYGVSIIKPTIKKSIGK